MNEAEFRRPPFAAILPETVVKELTTPAEKILKPLFDLV
jgi:hypothetical protein